MSEAKKSICDTCSSKDYCINRTGGVLSCINYNRFPKDKPERNR